MAANTSAIFKTTVPYHMLQVRLKSSSAGKSAAYEAHFTGETKG